MPSAAPIRAARVKASGNQLGNPDKAADSDIAEAAGITRGAMCFSFASKQDVFIALVARTAQLLQDKSWKGLTDTAPVDEVISSAIERTAQLRREHAAVMRVAVDLGSTVPEIDKLWTSTADAFAEATAAVLIRSGMLLGEGANEAPA